MSPGYEHGLGDAEAAPRPASLPRRADRHAVGIPEMGWRDAGLLAEHTAEMAGIGEAAAVGDVADLQVAALQQRLGMMHPEREVCRHRADAELGAEEPLELTTRAVQAARDLADR